ncbi:MAG TPA: NAD-dependent epimerase/dehydratase family protein [Ktedonobacterales bacterium]|nr:NAD-dependent epimerase/dehydratase family protein [Ktedonobacterales bacterium]
MRILVTGAAGFIGSHLAERLVAEGHDVVGLDCITDYYAPALKMANVRKLQASGVETLTLDLAVDDLGKAVEGVEAIYHLAAQPGLSPLPFSTYERNNIIATERLLMAARRDSALRLFANIATSSIYGKDATRDEDSAPRPASWYGVTKLAAEQLVLAAQRDDGFPACSFRLFSVYGPRERPDKLYPRLIHSILADEPFPLFEGSEHHQRSFTYVGDIVDGLLAPLSHADRCMGEIFNLGIETAITTGEGIHIVERIIGRPARIEQRPPRPGDQTRTQANTAKARAMLGYNPSTPPEVGLAEEVRWYRDEMFGPSKARSS